MFKGEFSINTARNCVCWLKKLSASFYKCLLFWTVLYILLMRYAWEVKRNRYWNCNYTFFFSNSCLIWRGGRKTNKPKLPKQKRWRVFGTLRVGNKWSPVNQITKLLPLMSRNNELFPRVTQLRLRACQSRSAKWDSTSGFEILDAI